MSNGPTLKREPSATSVIGISGAPGSPCALGGEQRRGERRRIDRHPQLRPQIEQRAVMVLVRVGEHDAGDVAPLLDRDSGCPGRTRSMPGRFSSLANDTPTSTISQVRLRCVAEPVEREVHADLADAAERREHQFACCGHRSCLRPAPASTSPAATVSHCRRRRGAEPSGRSASMALETARRSVAVAGLRRGSVLPMPAARDEPVGCGSRRSPRRGSIARAAPPSSAESASNTLSGVARTPAAARSVAGICGAGRDDARS